ncbi:hypothetical protein CDL15_Pgr004393 [Punica granatum]|nr:hypothetical protein CDL15_Pgr004393 [Punica granatum]
MVTLKSKEGETFEIDEAAAFLSMTIKRMVKEGRTGGATICLPDITANTVRKAKYALKIGGLLNLTCDAVSKMIRGMTQEEIR